MQAAPDPEIIRLYAEYQRLQSECRTRNLGKKASETVKHVWSHLIAMRCIEAYRDAIDPGKPTERFISELVNARIPRSVYNLPKVVRDIRAANA